MIFKDQRICVFQQRLIGAFQFEIRTHDTPA